jgi:hypothetical protein
LTLATTASGRWSGLDALLHLLNPFRRHRLPGPDRENDSARRGSPDPVDSVDRRSPLVAGRPTVASGAGSGDPRTAQAENNARVHNQHIGQVTPSVPIQHPSRRE